MARILRLSEEDTDTMFDLAAGERDNAVSPDLPEYISWAMKMSVLLSDSHATETFRMQPGRR